MFRGDVYRFRLPKAHEQTGERFGVVVQSEALPLSTVLVAPTSLSAKNASFRPEAEILGQQTRILVEQVGPCSLERLGELVGHLAPEELWGIDDALRLVLDL